MILGVIPARWGSTRLPGKALADIGGMPMIWHVYQRCIESDILNKIIVATDDQRIFDACVRRGMLVMMTQASHRNGTERVHEASLAHPSAEVIVNIQGDEPFIAPEAIRKVALAVHLDGHQVANGYSASSDPADLIDVTVPKVCVAQDGRAVYLSRSPIPYPKAREGWMFYIQTCAYAFRPAALAWFRQTNPGELETAEGIEILRFLEHGRRIKMVEVPRSPIAVDTEDDLRYARAFYEQARTQFTR